MNLSIKRVVLTFIFALAVLAAVVGGIWWLVDRVNQWQWADSQPIADSFPNGLSKYRIAKNPSGSGDYLVFPSPAYYDGQKEYFLSIGFKLVPQLEQLQKDYGRDSVQINLSVVDYKLVPELALTCENGPSTSWTKSRCFTESIVGDRHQQYNLRIKALQWLKQGMDESTSVDDQWAFGERYLDLLSPLIDFEVGSNSAVRQLDFGDIKRYLRQKEIMKDDPLFSNLEPLAAERWHDYPCRQLTFYWLLRDDSPNVKPLLLACGHDILPDNPEGYRAMQLGGATDNQLKNAAVQIAEHMAEVDLSGIKFIEAVEWYRKAGLDESWATKRLIPKGLAQPYCKNREQNAHALMQCGFWEMTMGDKNAVARAVLYLKLLLTYDRRVERESDRKIKSHDLPEVYGYIAENDTDPSEAAKALALKKLAMEK